MGRILRRALSIAFAAALVAACAAPTLPLPPPAVPNFTTAGVPGKVTLRSTTAGGAEANAIILVYNTDPSLPLNERVGGAQADAMGKWEAVIFGKEGDPLEISQQGTDGEWSPPADTQIHIQ